MAKGLIGLLAGVPSKGGAPEKGMPSKGGTDPETMAAEDLFAALESKDVESLKTAFRRMVAACKSDEMAEDEGEEDEAY